MQPVVVRPSVGRRVWTVVLCFVVLLVLPGVIALALALETGVGGVVGGLVLLAGGGWLFVVSVAHAFQRWVVTADRVELRRPLRRTRTWPRDGLRVSADSTPVYHRGVRAGTRRTLSLSVAGSHDSLQVGVLNGARFTRLVAALREPGQGDVRRELRGLRRAVDGGTPPASGRVQVDQEALETYRAWRLRWRLIGAAITVAGAVGTGPALASGQTAVGVALLTAALFVPAYVVASFVRQALHRRHGPTPLSVTVSGAGVDVERAGDMLGDRFAWTDLSRVEVSGDDDNGEVVLRLVPRSGEPTGYGLTGGATEQHRQRVLPDHDLLLDLLHDHGPPNGVDVVELQR